ncbi:hypothetical protein [Roseibium sp.]|uniref:hypothetical protein n=1 Tax=Roseibium sp. TaxID=1936156 RepID=UPI003B50BF24
MTLVTSSDASEKGRKTGLSPVLLFMVAMALLMVMSFAIAPSLLLPLSAFLAMAAATHLLGVRLYEDLRQAIDRNG